MARTAVLGRLTWLPAEVVDLIDETPRVRSIVLDIPGWPGHRAGQHVDVRLTAEDGYQAQRSYSIASAPDGSRIELTVERLDDGEVSPYLTDELLVAGGSGVVPLMAMIRTHAMVGSDADVRLLFSSRTWGDVIFRGELDRLGADGRRVVHTLTRAQPSDWTGYARRVDREMLAEVGPGPEERPLVFTCGPTPFVEAVAQSLVDLGHEPQRIKTERFGPTGG
jgi:ferredoxin-NADP reductase